MATESSSMSPYDQRVKLVRDIVKARLQLDDETASGIAVQVLHALDRIPEKVR